MPELEELNKKYGEQVQVLGIVGDVEGLEDTEHLELAKTITEKAGVQFTNVVINDDFKDFMSGIIGFPTTIFVDNAGNITKKSFTVAFIDKDAPIITGVTENAKYNRDVIINAIDNLSGIKTVSLIRNGTKIKYTIGEKIIDSGEYTVIVEDFLSNKSIKKFKIDRSLKDSEILISQLKSGWTNQDKKITITVKNKIKSIKINGKKIKLVNGSYTITVSNNSVYRVELLDLDGKVSTKIIEVSDIDKTLPVIYGVSEGKTYDEKVNLIVRDDLSGISSIIITNRCPVAALIYDIAPYTVFTVAGITSPYSSTSSFNTL